MLASHCNNLGQKKTNTVTMSASNVVRFCFIENDHSSSLCICVLFSDLENDTDWPQTLGFSLSVSTRSSVEHIECHFSHFDQLYNLLLKVLSELKSIQHNTYNLDGVNRHTSAVLALTKWRGFGGNWRYLLACNANTFNAKTDTSSVHPKAAYFMC